MSEPNPSRAQGEFRGLRLEMDFDRFAALEGLSGKKMPRLCTEFEMGLGFTDLVQWLRCFVVGDVATEEIKAKLTGGGGMMANYEEATGALGALMKAFFRPEEVIKKGKRPQKAE